MSLEVISLLKLPLQGYTSILKLKNEKFNRVLATSLHAPEVVVNELANSNSPMVSSKALRRSTDLELVNKIATGNSIKSIGALWNLNVSPEILEKQLDSENRTLAAIAYAHPHTPLEARKSKLTPELADKITDVGGALGEGVVRAMEITLNSPWLTEDPTIWPNLIKRAISNLPGTTKECLLEIKKSGWAGWKPAQAHPSKTGLDCSEMSPQELINIDSAASDLLAVGKQELTLDQAKILFDFRRNMPEPHVISRLVERFGMELFCGTYPIASTRVTSSSWRIPMIEYYDQFNKIEVQDYKLAVSILEENTHAWEIFLKLYSSWSGSVSDLARASLKL